MSDLMQLLKAYKNSKIALYGLSTETEKTLTSIRNIKSKIQIVGLLDSYREEGMLYGEPIISLKKAVESQIKLILVVARPGSCKAIAKRIGRVCVENQIDLVDIRGKNLCERKNITYDFKDKSGISKSQLLQLMDKNECVSIDLFDTLVMRQTLLLSDVFEIMDAQLKKQGVFIENFASKRFASEKELAKIMVPTLTEIYEFMLDTDSNAGILSDELAKLEWEIDYNLLIPRQEMCELLCDIIVHGKKVYIVSDTYYTREQIKKILEKCKIIHYTDILASCEYKTSKTQQLFEKLKEKIKEKSCIHIGDDLVADIEYAEKSGITACQIYSGIDLFEMTGYFGMWDRIENLSDRIKAGLFLSKLFNSPFQFETLERKIQVRTAYDIGFLVFAPIICDFIFWFDRQVQKNDLQNIWFCARDGYLIKKLYDELRKDNPSIYFLTSRIAAIRAGIKEEEDIRYVEEMKFSGTLQEQIERRFGISIERKEDRNSDSSQGLLEYQQELLEKALARRKGYQAYIRKLDRNEGTIAFFDFVAKGTVQMYIGRLIPNHLKGLYFLQLEEDDMEKQKLDILSFYSKEEKENSEVFENYYILETVLTAPAPSVQEFDRYGNPFYAEESRTIESIQCVRFVQEGILDYFKTYIRICPRLENLENKKLDEMFLTLLHSISVLERSFLDLKVEDPFFNRTTSLVDLL